MNLLVRKAGNTVFLVFLRVWAWEYTQAVLKYADSWTWLQNVEPEHNFPSEADAFLPSRATELDKQAQTLVNPKACA